MKIVEFFKKVGYMERVLEDINECKSVEEKRVVVLEWINDCDRGFELGDGEELDNMIDVFLEENKS